MLFEETSVFSEVHLLGVWLWLCYLVVVVKWTVFEAEVVVAELIEVVAGNHRLVIVANEDTQVVHREQTFYRNKCCNALDQQIF